MSSEPIPPNQSDASHNFAVLTIYQVVLRLGWIFKTESIIMPAVLDSIGGTATLRGFLPMLSRFALAIPPVLAAPRIRRARLKKRTLAWFTFWMGVSFLVLASCWLVPRQRLGNWFPYLFLAIYTIFFIFSGLNITTFGTVQGKIIPATLRGRLMLAANLIGCIFAIYAAFLLMPRWMNEQGGAIHKLFGFAGAAFLAASVVALSARESADESESSLANEREKGTIGHGSNLDGFGRVFAAIRDDKNLQRVAIMSAFGSCSIMLFPHYQALARERLGADLQTLMIWVTVQNFGTAMFSAIAGWVADRLGNRVVLQGVTAGLAVVPIIALLFSHSEIAPEAFSGVFFLIGLTPVFLRIVQHYTLELTQPENHPRYLAAVAICSAIPFLLSGVVGYAVEHLGFDIVFVAITLILLAAFAMTFRMREPRVV